MFLNIFLHNTLEDVVSKVLQIILLGWCLMFRLLLLLLMIEKFLGKEHAFVVVVVAVAVVEGRGV
jgi:inner membrane protein involved in colicin E2 resistance